MTRSRRPVALLEPGMRPEILDLCGRRRALRCTPAISTANDPDAQDHRISIPATAQHLCDRRGERYLDLPSGRGVFALAGTRNPERYHADSDMPNLVQMDGSPPAGDSRRTCSTIASPAQSQALERFAARLSGPVASEAREHVYRSTAAAIARPTAASVAFRCSPLANVCVR